MKMRMMPELFLNSDGDRLVVRDIPTQIFTKADAYDFLKRELELDKEDMLDRLRIFIEIAE